MIEPKEIEIDGRVYTISKFPAVAGREIVSRYTASGLPKIGDYKTNEETMLKLMGYVFVMAGEKLLPLSTRALIDNHVASWETLAKIEIEVMEYNVSFFSVGKISNLLSDFAQKLPTLVSKILMDLSVQSSQTEKPPSTN